MRKGSPRNAKRFCQNVVSSLPGGSLLYEDYFIGVNPTDSEKACDYKIIGVTPVSFVLIPCDEKELSFLECLLLREVVRNIESSHSFVLGVRFGPRVNKGPRDRVVTSLEVLLSPKGDDLFDSLLKRLVLNSTNYPLFDDIPGPYDWSLDITAEDYALIMPRSLKDFMVYLQNEEMPDGLAEMLDESLHWVVCDVGLAKLLTIPELSPKERSQDLPLTEEDASRIQLIQDVVWPSAGVRPNLDPHSIRTHWAKIPARLFVYGPILDFINAFLDRRMIKVCWNCGKLYRPWQSEYHEKVQHYCSSVCRRRAEGKRRHQREKERRKEPKAQN